MDVLLCKDINLGRLQILLNRYGMEIKTINESDAIPGSFWQPPEAGLVGNTLFIRLDTPVHSALHETCHYICMDDKRRKNLDTNAGGDYQEEDAVCYLQILLSDYITEMNKKRMLSDMDEWGYSFRLGSAQAWFDDDAEDAFSWLLKNNIIANDCKPTLQLRK
jgi:hypothetical protein